MVRVQTEPIAVVLLPAPVPQIEALPPCKQHALRPGPKLTVNPNYVTIQVTSYKL